MTNDETRMKNGRKRRPRGLISSLDIRHWVLIPHSGFVIRHLLCTAVLLSTSLSASAGTIRATIDSAEPVVHAWVIQRKDTNIGVENKPRSIRLAGKVLVVEGLPVPGRYDLRFKTASGCVVEGWDGHVPESDYVEEQPLDNESKLTILKKMAKIEKRHFADKVMVLDIQGNIQNAAIIVTKLRTRPFVGGAYKQGEWDYRHGVYFCLDSNFDRKNDVTGEPVPVLAKERSTAYKVATIPGMLVYLFLYGNAGGPF